MGGFQKIERAVIQPTGDEVRDGIIVDTDSPMAANKLKNILNVSSVTIAAPLSDGEREIADAVSRHSSDADLLVLIGGSGGGHRHSATLSKDYTHSTLSDILENSVSTSLYGKNGHLWSRLLVGYANQCLVINLPGPFSEAEAAMRTFCYMYPNAASLKELNKKMADAVRNTYGPAKNMGE